VLDSLPAWYDAPPEHRAGLAAMDRPDDDVLWKLARGRRSEAEMVRYDELLEQSAAGALGDARCSEPEMLRREAERFMLVRNVVAPALHGRAGHGDLKAALVPAWRCSMRDHLSHQLGRSLPTCSSGRNLL